MADINQHKAIEKNLVLLSMILLGWEHDQIPPGGPLRQITVALAMHGLAAEISDKAVAKQIQDITSKLVARQAQEVVK